MERVFRRLPRLRVPIAGPFALLVLLLGGAFSAPAGEPGARGQSPSPARQTPPASSEPAAGLPPPGTVPYTDPTFGFELHIPAGWRYDRGRFEGPEGAIGLIRGHNDSGYQALQVLVFRSSEVRSFPEWLERFEKQLAKLHGTQQIAEERWDQPPRPRAVLTVDTRVGADRVVYHYLCVPFDPATTWVLVLASTITPDSDLDAVRTGFDQLAASLKVLYDPGQMQEIVAALRRGLDIVAGLRRSAATLPIDSTPRCYEISIGGRPSGYLLRWMRLGPKERAGGRGQPREGLRVHEESWRFAEDGTARLTELDLFSTLDLQSELIESRATQVPAPDVQPQRLYIELDQVVRERDTLFSSFSTNLDPDLPDPRPPIPVGPGYVDLAWLRLLPRVLLEAPPESYAFWTYDSQARALVVQSIRRIVPAEEGTAVTASAPGAMHVFETREGFAAQPSRVYTDAQGFVRRIVSGDLVLTLAPQEEIERKYAAQREATRRRLSAPPPAAAPGAGERRP